MRHIDFIGKSKIWYTLSACVIICGIISMFIQGLNFGIDFTGGTLLDLKAEKPIIVEKVRKDILLPLGLKDNKIQMVANSNKEVIIRVAAIDEKKRTTLLNDFGQEFGQYQVMRIEKVSAVIGKELIWQAVLALVVASVLMCLYLAFRFEYRFGVSAIVGIAHDVAVVLTFASILRLQVDESFVAIILTVAGYSINDTIVIFDRIRENLGLMQRGETYAEVTNRSLNQSLTRCINTTGTVLAALLAVWIFGGSTIKDFIIGLFVGIATGAYSSIFMCCPIWVMWKQRDSNIMHAGGGGRKGKKKLVKA